MSQRKRFEPKLRSNVTLSAAAVLYPAAVAALWIFRNKVGLETADLLIITATAIPVILLTVSGRKKQRRLYEQSCELMERQEEIGTESPNDFFYRDDADVSGRLNIRK